METPMDELLEKVRVIAASPRGDLLRQIVDFMYECVVGEYAAKPLNIITMDLIKQAAKQIDEKRVPPGRESKVYDAIVEGRRYPPVYLYELAYHMANGSLRRFKAQEAIINLQKLGVKIVKK